MYPPQSVLIVTKKGRADAHSLGQQISQWFTAIGVSCRIEQAPVSLLPRDELIAGIDLTIVLGGDGTILGVARKLIGSAIPIFAINMGTVGFLTGAPATAWQEALQSIMAGNVQISPRLALAFSVRRHGELVASGGAINDLVIHRGSLARVISLGIAVDGQHLTAMRADGLIISSPTGATGYAVSAHGPLLHPALEVYSVTSICPFLCNCPPMVLPASSVCSVRVRKSTDEVYLTVDGQEPFALHMDDIITVQGMPSAFHLGTLEGSSYIDKLHTCGFVHETCTTK